MAKNRRWRRSAAACTTANNSGRYNCIGQNLGRQFLSFLISYPFLILLSEESDSIPTNRLTFKTCIVHRKVAEN